MWAEGLVLTQNYIIIMVSTFIIYSMNILKNLSVNTN